MTYKQEYTILYYDLTKEFHVLSENFSEKAIPSLLLYLVDECLKNREKGIFPHFKCEDKNAEAKLGPTANALLSYLEKTEEEIVTMREKRNKLLNILK